MSYVGAHRWRILIEHCCEQCGNGFSSEKPNPRFCSHTCYLEYNKTGLGQRASALWTDPEFKLKIQTARRQAGYPDTNRPEAVARRKLRAAAKNAVHRCLRGHGVFRLLGYTVEQFKTAIEAKFTAGMSWKNYGLWEIDHKRPISNFPTGAPVAVINALENLQPLWKAENRSKHGRF